MAVGAAKPPGNFSQAVLVIAVLAGVSAILAAGYFFVFGREMAVLYQDLRPTEAAAVVAELEAEQVEYQVRDGGSRILVPAANIDTIRLAVAASELPVKGLDGFELFDDTDMGLTDFAQKIKYQRALQGELARTIMRMEGVEEARVHISIPERSVFKSDRSGAKAAVALLTRSPEFETADRIEGIQELVASAIADLSTSDVVVINEHGKVISPRPAPDAPAPSPIAATEGEASIHQAGWISETQLAEALQRALPGRRFVVTRMAATTPADATSATDAQAPVRSSSLLVRVAADAPLTLAEQERARSELLATDASLSSETEVKFVFETTHPQTETVVHETVASEASVSVPVLARPQTPTPTASLPAQIPQGAYVWAGIAMAAVLILALAVVLLRLRGGRSTLSADDQQRLADRIRLGLQPTMHEAADEA